jgi:hypothetical protein
VRAIDLAHSAFANSGEHVVRAKSRSGCEAHCAGVAESYSDPLFQPAGSPTVVEPRHGRSCGGPRTKSRAWTGARERSDRASRTQRNLAKCFSPEPSCASDPPSSASRTLAGKASNGDETLRSDSSEGAQRPSLANGAQLG